MIAQLICLRSHNVSMMKLHTSFLYSRIVFKCLSTENRRERQIAVNGNIFFQFAEGMWVLNELYMNCKIETLMYVYASLGSFWLVGWRE